MKTPLRNLVLILGALLLIPRLSFSQTSLKQRDAFSRSYEFEAEKNYMKAAIEISNIYDENSYEHNLRLGWLNYRNGSHSASAKYYKKAIDLSPKSVEAYTGYVLPLSAMGNNDAVMEAYQEILKINPQNSIALYNVGVMHYFKKDYKNAAGYLEKAQELYPFDYYINLYLAWTYLQMERREDAKKYFNRTLLIVPTDPSALEGLLKTMQ